MHLVSLNDTDLLLGLWRGTITCFAPDDKSEWPWRVLTEQTWESHGKIVELCTPYLPSSFDRAPRNPAEKLNSGYKAWEFLLYIFGLGPALLRNVLPQPYWGNYCRFVRGIQLLQQRRVSPENLKAGHEHLCRFVAQFEEIYCQRLETRIHFSRWALHLLTHIAPQTIRSGPLACYSQWTMETAIGSLGSEIRQYRDPYANLTQRALLRAQTNSLCSIMPSLLPSDSKHPRGSKDLGDGFVLYTACDDIARDVTGPEAAAIADYWTTMDWPGASISAVKRWGRLHLPNGQVLRSLWSERRSAVPLRCTRMAKIMDSDDGKVDLAEIQYFFQVRFGEGGPLHTLAVTSLFTAPDQAVLNESFDTVYVCHYQGQAKLRVYDVKQITSLVAMVPNFKLLGNGDISKPHTEYFLVHKPYLDITTFRGEADEDDLID
ncbi:hypothetical protein C8J56DRAFT_786989 [Mycena floridula]|nr:hypothetical protein C8J56DRAFT_786989 [Mycena floridula]